MLLAATPADPARAPSKAAGRRELFDDPRRGPLPGTNRRLHRPGSEEITGQMNRRALR
jgi:hypothetical protein